MEKLLIIAEKPSAGRNFATALGGSSGTFDNDTYVIVNLRGHILAHETPEKVAFDHHAQTVGGFGCIDNIPWSHTWFDFNKRVVPKSVATFAKPVLESIRKHLREGYIPVIASDVDAMGEGDLLVQEVLDYVGYKGKIYREYHVDETPKSIQDALRKKKDVTARNDSLITGTTRMTLDFLTQQLVRVATVTIQNQGYKLPRPVPVGRLQSTIVNMVGMQLDAIEAYVPSSLWESRYNLDGILVLSNPDVTSFKTKEEWHAEGYPDASTVREVKQTPGRTVPPKALTLTGLGKLLSRKGLRSKKTNELAQAMYDAGVLSYPRTEDNFITPEQFTEMLPVVDTIITMLGLSPELFTHRTPRSTHVKTGGSHGALRPGVNIPPTIDELDARFGKGAAAVYRNVAERFVMMFLEDTEWVKHEYETVDTPVPFKGSLRIITKRGVTDPDEEVKDIATTLPNLAHKAMLYPHEVKSSKPKSPTEAWLLGELEKHHVGTASTQVTTVGRLIGSDDNTPLRVGAKTSEPLKLTPIGVVGYKVANKISLGTPECTRKYEQMIREVVKNEKSQAEVFAEFTATIRDDANTIKGLSFDLQSLGFPTTMVRVSGVWQGNDVSIPNSSNGHTFSEAELAQLFAGQTIQIDCLDFNKQPTKSNIKLGYVFHKGQRYVGFHDALYYYGKWEDREIRFKRQYMGYHFSDDECEALLRGYEITFEGKSKSGNMMSLSGKLAEQSAPGGQRYIGILPKFPLREGYVEGVYKKERVQFKGAFCDHTFTEKEIERLLAGDRIVITYTTKKQTRDTVEGKLEWQTYNDRRFLGFKPDFDAKFKAQK